MKILTLISALLFAVCAHAQTVVSTITTLGSNPTFADDGSLLTAPVQALFNEVVTVADKDYATTASVTWDGTDTKRTVTINGKTLTYAEATAAIAAIAKQEKAAAPGTQAAAKKEAAPPAP